MFLNCGAAKLKAEKDALKHELDENIAKREVDKHTISEYRSKLSYLERRKMSINKIKRIPYIT
jgi:hypothetical protein